ncbi:type II secretion system F family protein [Undibacterium parvum]|uniref:Type II secretion system protein n=1 Tax=Undibacterium parvum TaxID=401471 RepID=A0A3Q9BNH0_9BURK|nr:type II secretion system F family protein [Undibacterium parvum]AZP10960.1 type II secretion system protein [Undibacterium parvum]
MSSFSPLSFALRAQLYQHLAAMEKAGLPTDKAFALLKLAAPAKQRVDQARKLLGRGKDIASAGQQSGLFGELDAQLLRAATSAGSPAKSYQRLAEMYAQKASMRQTILARMRLPVAIFILSLLIQPLPALVSGSLSAKAYLWGCLRPPLILAALYYLGRAILNRRSNSLFSLGLDRLLLQLPIFGVMHVRHNVRDFFESLGLMLEAGLPMLEALPKASQTMGNQLLRAEFEQLFSRVQRGATLAEASAHLKHLPEPYLISLIQSGEASGTLPDTLLRYASGETEILMRFQQQLADWLPRLVYGAVMLSMAYSLLSSGAFMPQLPDELK